MAVILKVVWRHVKNQTPSSWRTILPNFIPIRLENGNILLFFGGSSHLIKLFLYGESLRLSIIHNINYTRNKNFRYTNSRLEIYQNVFAAGLRQTSLRQQCMPFANSTVSPQENPSLFLSLGFGAWTHCQGIPVGCCDRPHLVQLLTNFYSVCIVVVNKHAFFFKLNTQTSFKYLYTFVL